MNTRPSAHARLRHVAAGLFLGFGLVALALIFWSALRAGQILAREDNPRLVEAALRVQRGQILDRNGLVLAETVGSGRDVRRVYPITGSGPAVGYYSFRHGAAGVEESYDDVLRGANEPAAAGWWRAQLHQPQVGQAVQTTLDAALQQQADAALGAHPGAVVLLDLTQPEIARVLALASHPGYDPNLLDAQFEALIADETAPLLNRAAQGQYQPGLVLQPFLWAAAYERGLVTASEAVDNANRPVPVNGIVTRCAGAPPAAATWGDALAQRCPGPMQALAAQFGAADFSQALADFGLLAAPRLPLNTETPPPEPLADLALAGIGQDTLTVTPLQVARALAALATNGRLPPLQLVTAVQDAAGAWQAVAVVDVEEETAVSPQTAQTTRDLLPVAGETPGFGGREHAVLVLSGPEGSTNAWYLGLYPAAAPRYVLVIVLEGAESVARAVENGRGLLRAVTD